MNEAKSDRVSCSYGRRINVSDDHSIWLTLGSERDVREGETLESARAELSKEVIQDVERRLRQMHRKILEGTNR
jgi:hypothetical protein